jgi:FdhD protein
LSASALSSFKFVAERKTIRRSEPGVSGISSSTILRWRKTRRANECDDFLAREEPLEIRVRGRSIAVTMRTPGHEEELAAGFLLTEGLIRERRDVVEIAHCRRGEAADRRNTLNVFLSPAVEVSFERLTRHVFASSSCGLCGKASIEAVHQHFPPIATACQVAARTLPALVRRLQTAQQAFKRTGGLHAAAVFDGKGNLIVVREDVGRHNAVDKVVGYGFLRDRLPFDKHILLVSGRASFEIMQKALAARIPVVCAISAPSSLAVEFAREGGQTLIGFLRGDSFNVYSRPDRVSGLKPKTTAKAK